MKLSFCPHGTFSTPGEIVISFSKIYLLLCKRQFLQREKGKKEGKGKEEKGRERKKGIREGK